MLRSRSHRVATLKEGRQNVRVCCVRLEHLFVAPQLAKDGIVEDEGTVSVAYYWDRTIPDRPRRVRQGFFKDKRVAHLASRMARNAKWNREDEAQREIERLFLLKLRHQIKTKPA